MARKWFVTGSLVCAGLICSAAAAAAASLPRAAGRVDAATITDGPTGIVLSMSDEPSGSVTFSAEGQGLRVAKTIMPAGRFSLRVQAGSDAVTLTGSPGQLTVARNGRAVAIVFAQAADARYQEAAALLAGSPAIRAFRRALSRMATTTAESRHGIALQFADAWLRIAQDDSTVAVERVRRQAAGAGEVARAMRTPAAGLLRAGSAFAAPGAGRGCFAEWRQEVLGAWNEYESCYFDFKWWSGGREVCAAMYVLEAESAWFRFLSCSAIKIQ